MALIPATAHWTERIRIAFGNAGIGFAQRASLDSVPDSDEYGKLVRHSDCDEDGHFRFERVADGKYYLLSKITWLVRWQRNGGGLMSAVEVRNGESKIVILTADLRHTSTSYLQAGGDH